MLVLVKKYLKINNSKDLLSNLTKIKALVMTSIDKITFNIDGQTIRSTLNIPIQQIYQTYH